VEPDQSPTKVVGQRIGAFLIDALVFVGLGVIAWFALTDRLDADSSSGGGFVIGHTRYAFTSSSNRGIWIAIVILLALAIYVVMTGLRGSSPGKLATGIRTVGADGSPPGLARAALRSGVGLVADGFPYFLPGLTGLILVLATKDNQRVGDMAARTWVVRREAAGRPIAEILRTAPAPAPAPAAPAPAQRPAASATQPAAGSTAQPAGWYADPRAEARLRWWDGSAWTEHVAQ
jgi:uncharacterized RDD family membrane protein YckC